MQPFPEWHRAQLAADGGPPRWALDRASALSVYESLAPPPAETAAHEEVARLRHRVGKLENAVRQVCDHLDTRLAAFSAVRDRVNALEARPAGLVHRGSWSDDAAYEAGDVVTAHGSAWIAKCASTAVSPGAASTGVWQCLVRRGRDGRDARPTEPVLR